MSPAIRVLMVEDAESDALLLAHHLEREGYQPAFERVDTPEAMRAALAARPWDLILADDSLAGFGATEALALVREVAPDLPFIVVSGAGDEAGAARTLRAGAHDVIVKGNWARLGPAIARELRAVEERRERRRVEEALSAGEERFRALVENSADAIVLLDADGTVRADTPGVTNRLLGYSANELVGRRVLELVHPEDLEKVNAMFGELAESQDIKHAQFRIRHKNGSWPWMEAVGANLLDHPAVGAIVVNARDISDRKRAEEAGRRRLIELATVHKVSSALRAAETEAQALAILLEQILAALETEAGAIYLYDATDAVLRGAVARGWMQDLAEAPIKPGEGIAGAVFASGQAFVAPDFADDPPAHRPARGQLPAGWGGACLPIRSAAEVLGAIQVCVRLPREITPEQMRLLESLAEMAGAALHRMRLHRLTEQRLQRLTALRDIDQAISASVDLRLTLGILVDQVVAQLRPDAVEVLLLDPHANMLNYAAGRGFKTNLPGQAHVRLGQPIAGQVALERRIMTERDFRPEELPAELSRYFAAEGFVAYTGVPLIAKGRVQGVLDVFHRSAFHPSADWLDFLEALASQAAIAVDNAALFQQLQRSNAELVLAYDATIEGWSRAMDLRDKETEGHTRRVTELTVMLARTLGVSEEEIVHIRRGALLHDIGKIGVPDAILSKPGPLSEAEWAIMRQHPTLAYEMLAPIAYLSPALDIPYCHHEKWDGTGYPRGLRGREIPLAARIFAVVDVWDALRSERPYRPAWPAAQARAHIRAASGWHLDPGVVAAFLRLGRLPE